MMQSMNRISSVRVIILRFIFGMVITFLYLPLIAQQDAKLLAAFHEGAIINPSLIGSEKSANLLILGRQQWFNTDGAPAYQFIQLNTPLKNEKAGTGLSLSHYSAGYFSEIDFSLAYAYKIQWSKKVSSRIGLQASIKNYGIDFTNNSIITQRTNDPSIPLGTKVNQFKGTFGLGWSLIVEDWLKLGIALPRLYSNDIGINEAILNTASIDPILLLSIHGRLPGTKGVKIYPSIILRKVDFLPITLDFNVTLALKNLLAVGIGTSGSNGVHGVHLNSSYRLSKKWRIGLFYEWPTSTITQIPTGSIEVLLKYQFKHYQETEMSNPRFFF